MPVWGRRKAIEQHHKLVFDVCRVLRVPGLLKVPDIAMAPYRIHT